MQNTHKFFLNQLKYYSFPTQLFDMKVPNNKYSFTDTLSSMDEDISFKKMHLYLHLVHHRNNFTFTTSLIYLLPPLKIL